MLSYSVVNFAAPSPCGVVIVFCFIITNTIAIMTSYLEIVDVVGEIVHLNRWMGEHARSLGIHIVMKRITC